MKRSTTVEHALQQRRARSTTQEFCLLVPVDFSEGSYTALTYAMRMASVCGGKIEIFHGVSTSMIPYSENPLTVKRALSSVELKARKKINSLIEIISENGVSASSTVEYGNMSLLLRDQIKKMSNGMVVVGQGSALEKTLKATCHTLMRPLLVVPPAINPIAPSRIWMISDHLPIREDSLKPLSVILGDSSNHLTVIDTRPSLLRRLIFKYPVQIEEKIIGVHRKFHCLTSSAHALDDLIARQKPDMLCQINRPRTFLRKLLEFFFISKQQRNYNVPTLIISAS